MVTIQDPDKIYHCWTCGNGYDDWRDAQECETLDKIRNISGEHQTELDKWIQ